MLLHCSDSFLIWERLLINHGTLCIKDTFLLEEKGQLGCGIYEMNIPLLVQVQSISTCDRETGPMRYQSQEDLKQSVKICQWITKERLSPTPLNCSLTDRRPLLPHLSAARYMRIRASSLI